LIGTQQVMMIYWAKKNIKMKLRKRSFSAK